MLDIALRPKHGNASGRFYPHSGHLGVSPVVISGSAVSKLMNDQICQPLHVKSIVLNIVCYETRSGGPFASDREHILWHKSTVLFEPPAGEEYHEMSEWNCPFRQTIPIDIVKRVPSSQWLKDWKVGWKIEVILQHKPIPFVGERKARAYKLDLYDHRLPSVSPPSPPSALLLGQDATSTQIFLSPPHGAFGPGDVINYAFGAKPEDATTIVRKVVVTLERTIEHLHPSLDGTASSSSSSVEPSRDPSPEAAASPHRSRISSLFSRTNSTASRSPEADSSARTIVGRVCEATCLEPVLQDSGLYWSSVDLALPRRGGRWDIGETTRTNLVSLSFQLKVKVYVKSLKPRAASKELSCPPIPIVLCASSSVERALAQAAVTPVSPPKPPKRKHRSSRRGLYQQEGTIEISEDVVALTKRRSLPPSPAIASIIGVATDVKPILLPPDHIAGSQKISFTFPSPPPQGDSLEQSPAPHITILPPIHTLLREPYPSPSPSTSFLAPSADYESLSILRQFRQTGRRISSTSEEEESQPLRTRQKTTTKGSNSDEEAGFAALKPSLPSLGCLGLGLPQLPDEGRPRRPTTAPSLGMSSRFAKPPPPLFGASTSTSTARPMTSMGRMTGHRSQGSAGDTTSGGSMFAFGMARREDEPPK
ncbi:hypothetical protein P7C73_g1598, partial [Tremellales sp. Uapishka_1]